jgi:hypothetical protein
MAQLSGAILPPAGLGWANFDKKKKPFSGENGFEQEPIRSHIKRYDRAVTLGG